MASIPLPALQVNQNQPSPIDTLSKLMQIRYAQGQQAMLPGELQQQQQQIQSTGLDIQQKQLALKNNQIRQSVLGDPNFEKDFEDWQSSKPSAGVDSGQAAPTTAAQTVPLHPLAQFLAEKKGLPLFGPGGALDTSDALTASTQKIAELAKTQGEAGTALLTNHGKQLDNFDDLVEPVLAETDPAKQTAGIAQVQSEIQAHPELYPPEATQHLGTMNTIQGLQVASNTSKVRQMLIEDATKQAQAGTAAATQTKTELDIAKPTQQQLDTFTKTTLPSFTNMLASQRAAFAQQAQQARTVPELQKVQEAADATDKAMQMHADTLAQTRAIVGTRFDQQKMEAGLKANETIWTDPQHGYQQIASSARLAKQALQAGANGSGLATSLAPLMTVMGINNFDQMRRLAPAEAQAAGMPGGYVERFNAWASKAFTGKLSPQVAAEGKQLTDQLLDIAHTRAVQSSQFTASQYGLGPQAPAMDRDGNVTTLDKAVAGSAQGGGPSNAAVPANDPFAQFGGKKR